MPAGTDRARSDASAGVADGHHLGRSAPRLVGEPLDRTMSAEGDHVEPLGRCLHDLERLGADRAGRPITLTDTGRSVPAGSSGCRPAELLGASRRAASSL